MRPRVIIRLARLAIALPALLDASGTAPPIIHHNQSSRVCIRVLSVIVCAVVHRARRPLVARVRTRHDLP